MRFSKLSLAGTVLVVAILITLLSVIIAVVLYPGFDMTTHLVDELAFGPYALIYPVASLILCGLLLISAALLIQNSSKQKLFPSLLVITGIITVGLGVFTASYSFHALIGLIWVVFGSLTAIFTYKIVKSQALRYLSVILVVAALISLFFIVSGTTFGIGIGLIGLPGGFAFFVWALILGLYLTFGKADVSAKQ